MLRFLQQGCRPIAAKMLEAALHHGARHTRNCAPLIAGAAARRLRLPMRCTQPQGLRPAPAPAPAPAGQGAVPVGADAAQVRGLVQQAIDMLAQGELPHQQLVQLQPWVDAAKIKTIQEALDSFELVQAQNLLAQLIT